MFINREILKRIALVLFIGFLFNPIEAEDILILNNTKQFEGKVTKIKNCMVTFKVHGEKFQIPAYDIFSIEFGDKQDQVYTKYVKQLEVDPGKCVSGRLDAANYHGKKSSHIALGFLFGPFAMLGTALANPTPQKGKLTYRMSENSELFSDPDYLECYKQKVKGRLIGAEAIGFGIAALMILMITPTYLNSQ